MRAFTLLFMTIASLAFIAIGALAYFSFTADWGRLAEGSGTGGSAAAPAAVASAAPVLNEQETAGKELFNANCAACHKPVGNLVGPQLSGVQTKYAGDEEWLYSWVKNSSALIKKGDAKAVALYEQYGKQQMTAFPNLKNEDIDAILAYADAMAR
jgi:mono/diheme cytochrome c family protein